MFEIIIGILAGIISGMGMGGGTILILALIIFLGIEQHIAQATNLLYFIPTSIVATIINSKSKKINWKIVPVIVTFGSIGAIIGSQIATRLNGAILRKYFGFFLGIIAINEIYNLIKMNNVEKKNK